MGVRVDTGDRAVRSEGYELDFYRTVDLCGVHSQRRGFARQKSSIATVAGPDRVRAAREERAVAHGEVVSAEWGGIDLCAGGRVFDGYNACWCSTSRSYSAAHRNLRADCRCDWSCSGEYGC